jgi:orotate phosphoribosyltransferase
MFRPNAEATRRRTLADRIFRRSGAILEGDHFVYISGDHGGGWVDKDAIYPHTDRVSGLAKLLAEAVREFRPEVVCGPATGGLIVAQWTAHYLGVLSVFAEHDHEAVPKAEGAAPPRPPIVLRRGYDRLVAGRDVLVVDDVVNTGLSLRQTAQAVRAAGGRVVAAASLCSRGNATTAEIGVNDYVFLVEYAIPDWPADGCPLCRDGVPINARYAHGQDFLDGRFGSPPAR